MIADQNPQIALIDAALACWRQGDRVLDGGHWFAHRIDTGFPLTEAGHFSARDGASLTEQRVAGFAIVTQTCDIVRTCTERPYVAVSPLVGVDLSHMRAVQRGMHPKHAFLPGLRNRGLVADLDRVMTIEKPVVAKWTRTPGCLTDSDVRDFALALIRSRARFAFPDDFTSLVKKLRTRLVTKHDKGSDEGRALRALREVRVRAVPSWDAGQVALTFWFVRNPEPDFDGRKWEDFHQAWQALVGPAGRFVAINTRLVELHQLSAREYVDSDPLDLDHLSTRPAAESDCLPQGM